jgi:hypothetical protein
VTGVLGFLGAITAAKINKRKSGPEPMPAVTVDYAYPRNSPHSAGNGARKLRRLSVSLVVVAGLLFGWFAYEQATTLPEDSDTPSAANEIRLAPAKVEAITVRDSVTLDCTNQQITYTAGNLIDRNPNTAW